MQSKESIKWRKRGLIFCPEGELDWARHTVLTPTPILLDECIRIYGGFRDEHGVSRIGFIDVSVDNPSEVLRVSDRPVLDVGEAGMFDDNGVILGDLILCDDGLRMYYVGFQKVAGVKFLAYSGVALSKNGGVSFERVRKTPIMDRCENALFIRAIHTVIQEGDSFKIWYSVGMGWEEIDGVKYPRYNIRYVESRDGYQIDDDEGVFCLGVEGDEYRIGRPRVRRLGDGYEMRFTADDQSKNYRAGVAHSTDGVTWVRANTDLDVSSSGWDSEMVCYPVALTVLGKEYLFYSGNAMGASGVGYAERA